MESSEFPIQQGLRRQRVEGCPTSVPWSVVTPHETQAQRNHGQSLPRLAQRGGLSPDEMLAVLEDRDWERMDREEAVRQLRNWITEVRDGEQS